MILLKFYIFAVSLILPISLVSLLGRHEGLLKRCLTLFVLANLVCLILYLGKLPFTVFLLLLTLTAVLEIAAGTKASKLITGLLTAASGGFYILIQLVPDMRLVALFLFGAASVLLFCLSLFSKPHSLNWLCSLFLVAPGFAMLSVVNQISLNHTLAILLLAQFNDVAAYFVGKKFGKTKPAFLRQLSPGKTLEGFAGGFLGTGLALVLLATLLPLYRGQALIFRLLISGCVFFFFTNFGDLAFSAVKRKLGLKDFSRLLSGHGGLLDRFDSILYLAPAYFVLLQSGIIME